ncbi:glycoside hydrolase family 47 protein [Coniophora puteana RWD-64-598 SS2]|uniref:alpha-1,2-Mannosidase n=1 Tax=Coniophora puteana (strain RWD-64-598) TaxID=741705 RepID=A0A5M3N646_CONPW|nr:glycoside hydrolase family 47 protein [Coniophora puteana RWD-64-598 SS2]EIW86899.1 glycoside hydrolase family 47 protein [Coniophora puteana RWD-64-598 SS2]
MLPSYNSGKTSPRTSRLRWRWGIIAVAAVLVVYVVAAGHQHPKVQEFVSGASSYFDYSQSRPELTGTSGKPVSSDPQLWASRADQVKEAFKHALDGYLRYADLQDELQPLTGGKINNFNGWSTTLLDSMSTMWLMDLKDDFEAALPVVANLSFATTDKYVPFFETTIRCLGGLLSAYALSGEPMLLARADDLGQALLPVFDTPSGLPMYGVNPSSGATKTGWAYNALWSELTSCQLEYKYLAHLTGRTDYFDKSNYVMELMRDEAASKDGLYATGWSIEKGTSSNQIYSVGAFADSGYEYFLKQYLLTGKSEEKIKDMYLKSIRTIINELFYLSPTRNLLYVTDVSQKEKPSYKLEHLSCFLAGLLALGAHTLDLPDSDAQMHRWAAQGLAHTCYITYADSVTGLGPDEVQFNLPQPENGNILEITSGRWVEAVDKWMKEGSPGGVPPGLVMAKPVKDGEKDYAPRSRRYHLRPETVESFYILWRTTGDESWREKGWELFQAINKHARTEYGFASVNDVTDKTAPKLNEMPSYFLAETLKYLYLLFTDEEIIPLDEWVFNTEAHPLPVFKWHGWEKTAYSIP